MTDQNSDSRASGIPVGNAILFAAGVAAWIGADTAREIEGGAVHRGGSRHAPGGSLSTGEHLPFFHGAARRGERSLEHCETRFSRAKYIRTGFQKHWSGGRRRWTGDRCEDSSRSDLCTETLFRNHSVGTSRSDVEALRQPRRIAIARHRRLALPGFTSGSTWHVSAAFRQLFCAPGLSESPRGSERDPTHRRDALEASARSNGCGYAQIRREVRAPGIRNVGAWTESR